MTIPPSRSKLPHVRHMTWVSWPLWPRSPPTQREVLGMIREKLKSSRLRDDGGRITTTEVIDASYCVSCVAAKFGIVHKSDEGATTSYVVFRRREFITLARAMADRLATLGRFKTSWRSSLRDMLRDPGEHVPGLWPAHYGGPGSTFCNRPLRVRSSRRFVVFRQRSGVDI